MLDVVGRRHDGLPEPCHSVAFEDDKGVFGDEDISEGFPKSTSRLDGQ